ncbi:hypothetical protein GWI34_02185 [Actinomadura sp. DSM 109109]|nr:hypothetical protein [Actinomadura lepetitiana]
MSLENHPMVDALASGRAGQPGDPHDHARRGPEHRPAARRPSLGRGRRAVPPAGRPGWVSGMSVPSAISPVCGSA